MYKYLIIILLCFSSSVSSIIRAEIVVISNVNFPLTSLDKADLRKLWLGKTKRMPGIGRIQLFDQMKDKKITKQFYFHITHKNPNQVKAYWAKMLFIGKGFPPKQLDTDSDVIKWVLKTKNSIGYINIDSLTNTIKILTTIKDNE